MVYEPPATDGENSFLYSWRELPGLRVNVVDTRPTPCFLCTAVITCRLSFLVFWSITSLLFEFFSV